MSENLTDTPGVFRFALEALRAQRDFTPFRPGVEIWRLYGDETSGASAAVLRYAPGASVPEHIHQGYEHVLILEGEQCDHRGAYPVGTFIVNLPGTRHAVSSPKGCVALLIWQHPVRFVDNGAEAISARVVDEAPGGL
jgi:anti-sigma factor ChrR (cupin superfamily)